MIPVWQTTISGCERASLASILELSIEEVPDFFPAKEFKEIYTRSENKWFSDIPSLFHQNVENWLWNRGLMIIRSMCNFNVYHLKTLIWNNFAGAHTVVGYGYKIVHDPEPFPTYLPSDFAGHSWNRYIVPTMDCTNLISSIKGF